MPQSQKCILGKIKNRIPGWKVQTHCWSQNVKSKTIEKSFKRTICNAKCSFPSLGSVTLNFLWVGKLDFQNTFLGRQLSQGVSQPGIM